MREIERLSGESKDGRGKHTRIIDEPSQRRGVKGSMVRNLGVVLVDRMMALVSASHGPVAFGDDGLVLFFAGLEVGKTQLLSDHGDGRDPVDSEQQGGGRNAGKGDPDEQTDPEALQAHSPLETEEGADRKTLRYESTIRLLVCWREKRGTNDNVISDQVEDGSLPDQAEDTHGTTTDTDDTVGRLEQRDVDRELGDTSDDDGVRGKEISYLMPQDDEQTTDEECKAISKVLLQNRDDSQPTC